MCWDFQPDPNTYTGVSGTGTVPNVKSPPGSKSLAEVSEWVGIDGRHEQTPALIQIGVGQDCPPGGAPPNTYAWYETIPEDAQGDVGSLSHF